MTMICVKMAKHRGPSRKKIIWIFLFSVCSIVGVTFRVHWKSLEMFHYSFFKYNYYPKNISFPSLTDQEVRPLMKVIEWPEPPGPTGFEFSTSPLTTDFHMLSPRAQYIVGDHVEVLITARDHHGQPKTYGGDYFQAKLHSPELKAGVTGSVTDHRNGTYTASFLLLWSGKVEISIKLVHSSEAIAIIKDKRETRPDKVTFYGYFDGINETTECNVELPGPDVCEYRDPHTGESWFCKRPGVVPCSAYKGHSEGVMKDILTPDEAQFLSEKETLISSKGVPLTVLPQENITDSRPVCSPGIPNPEPSGFYYQDTWYSRSCRNRDFPKPSDVTRCLAGKTIYMMGDSTTRLWWKFLLDFIPSLHQLNLHRKFPGFQMAIDTTHGFAVQWQAHERPLSMKYIDKEELHYIANELDRIGRRKENLVIVINCNAHFVSLPVRFYLRRLHIIRDSVLRLVTRSPLTKIFLKSASTGYLYTYGSDWLSLQLDLVMRTMFSGLPVTIVDAWEMTSCHYLPQTLHPGTVIIKNQIDLLLSNICPE